MKSAKSAWKYWDIYKHRFVPWIAWKHYNNPKMAVPVNDKCIPDANVLGQLINIFEILEHDCQSADFNPYASFQSATGFQVDRKASGIPDAGQGVFVTAGHVSEGQVVALYPGAVYAPMEFVFFPSIGNSFLFRCKDNFHVDGKDTGISKSIYKSCAFREKVGKHEVCDLSWLTASPVCIMNVGQYINNRCDNFKANVQYQEFNFQQDFPFKLRRFIPNVCANGNYLMPFLRSVAIVATRPINIGEEIFSTYFTSVGSDDRSNV